MDWLTDNQRIRNKTPDEILEKIYLIDAIENALNKISNKERKIITRRFGLNDGNTRTLERVSKEIGLSPSRIGAIQKRVIERLSHKSYGLVVYIGDCQNNYRVYWINEYKKKLRVLKKCLDKIINISSKIEKKRPYKIIVEHFLFNQIAQQYRESTICYKEIKKLSNSIRMPSYSKIVCSGISIERGKTHDSIKTEVYFKDSRDAVIITCIYDYEDLLVLNLPQAEKKINYIPVLHKRII